MSCTKSYKCKSIMVSGPTTGCRLIWPITTVIIQVTCPRNRDAAPTSTWVLIRWAGARWKNTYGGEHVKRVGEKVKGYNPYVNNKMPLWFTCMSVYLNRWCWIHPHRSHSHCPHHTANAGGCSGCSGTWIYRWGRCAGLERRKNALKLNSKHLDAVGFGL